MAASATCANPRLCAAVLNAATEYAIIGTDEHGLITVFNGGAQRLLGFDAEEVVGRVTPLAFHDAAEVAARAAELQVAPGFDVFVAAARHDEPETREWVYVRRDGTRLPVSLTVTAMHGEDGALVGFLGIARDISDRRRAALERHRAEEERAQLLQREREARRAAERAAERTACLLRLTEAFSEALSPSQVATALLEHGLATLGASGGFVGLLSVEGAYLDLVPAVGNPPPPTEVWRRIHLGADVPAAAAVRTRRPIFLDSSEALAASFPLVAARLEANGVAPDHHAWAAVPLLADGQTIGAIGLTFPAPRAFDVEDQEFVMALAHQCGQALERTRLIEAEQRARAESEQLKDEFFANVSHDLRTPVAAIKASIGVVLANEPPGTPPALHRMLSNIDQAADRMTSLVNDLLELTRLQAGRIQLEPDVYDLREVAARAAAEIEPLAQSRGQRVSVALPREPVMAVLDEKRLERALLNLLSNAHKYGRAGGNIRLSVERGPGEAVITVADDGPGVPKEEQERIFQRFYRTDALPARSGEQPSPQGSGLGLAIARAMVALHHGRIWVESEAGQGAAFRIALPVPGAAKEEVDDEDPGSGRRPPHPGCADRGLPAAVGRRDRDRGRRRRRRPGRLLRARSGRGAAGRGHARPQRL